MKIFVQKLRRYMRRIFYDIKKKKVFKSKEDYGFGMWGDREEMKNVGQYVCRIRKGRFPVIEGH